MVKVPKIIVALPALFELVKISETVVFIREVVCTIVLMSLRLVVKDGFVWGFVVGL